jgi:hypothetical protein
MRIYFPRDLSLPFLVWCIGLFFSCGKTTVEYTGDSPADTSRVTVSYRIGGAARSPLLGQDNRDVWQASDCYIFAWKATATILPPTDVIVSDVPNDNGHFLTLTWSPSVSENNKSVKWYYIYRSRSSELTEPKALSDFTDIESLNAWEAAHTVLVDSTEAGTTDYTDCVTLAGVTYYYWMQSVGTDDLLIGGENTVSGRVTDKDGMPLEGVLIRLYDGAGIYDTYTVSLSDGSYKFEKVPSGSYFLVATRDDYTLFSTTVIVP